MNTLKTAFFVIIPLVIIVLGITIFRSINSQHGVVGQTASLYGAIGADGQVASVPVDAITWQDLGKGQCIGLNNEGQGIIGESHRKTLSFSKNCTISGDFTDESNPVLRDNDNSHSFDRFWFGSLFGLQCYAVARDNEGIATQVFLDNRANTKEACLGK